MGGLFKKPKIPEVKPPQPMPDPDDLGAKVEQRKELLKARERAGRASTVLSDGPASSYSGTTLGIS